MTPNELLEQIEGTPDNARALLKKNNVTGINRAFCDRVVQYFGTDTGKALALSSLWQVFKNHGDEPAPALRARAICERLRGKWGPSARAFEQAGDAAEDAVEKLSFKVGAIDSFARGGRVDKAVMLGEHLAAELNKLNERGLAARVHLNLGNALFWQDRMEEARHHLSAATPLLRNYGFLVEAASAEMALSTTHLYGGHLAEAKKHAETAKAAAEQVDAPYLADLCEINLAHVDILSGRPDTALDRLLPLKDRLLDAPVDLARTMEFVGDAYLRLNLWPEAVDAYHEALASGALIALHRAHLHLGLGQALAAAGRHEEAITELRRADAAYRRLKNDAWRAAALTALAKSYADAGLGSHALQTVRRAVRVAESSEAPYHQAEALLALCFMSPELGALERAANIIQRQGYMGLLWQVHYLRTRWRSKGRMGHYRRMFEAIQAGRLRVHSLSSRSSFLRDKTYAIQEYLSELLSKHTRKYTEEALEVIQQTRSVTLLDELVSARGSALDPKLISRLNQLREELHVLGADEFGGGAARRLVGSALPIASAQRRWIELTHDLRASVQRAVPAAREDSLVLVQALSKFYAISGGVPRVLSIEAATLERSLKWLQFELLAPLADRDAEPTEALRILGTLGRQLLGDLNESNRSIAVCPDGILWRVPWSACAGLLDKEAELRLHPSLGGNMTQIISKHPRVALWSSNAPDLLHAGLEAKQFMERFPDARVFSTADQIRTEMAGAYDLIHVVAHAKHRSSNPMFSAVAFDDGPLYASEIARLGIKPNLVTLSACETGTMSVISRDEPDGLARAFLARGAKNVIASMWPLDDEAATRMFGNFFHCLVGSATIAESLNEARQDARKWRTHPYFWGSLALYGGYSEL